jgi:hypothetical protein
MLSVVIDNEESTLEFVDFTEHEVILFHFTNTVPIPNTPDTTYNYHCNKTQEISVGLTY